MTLDSVNTGLCSFEVKTYQSKNTNFLLIKSIHYLIVDFGISEIMHIFPKLQKLQGYNNAIFKLKKVRLYFDLIALFIATLVAVRKF